jgi:hypothetical protein
MVAIRYLNINSESRVSPRVAGCYYPRMNLRAVRLANLRVAITRAGGIDVLADAAQVSKKYLEQILTGFQGKKDKNPRSVGNTLAEKLSEAIGEPAGWMDQPHPEDWEAADREAYGTSAPGSEKHARVANARFATSAEPWPFSNVPYARIANLTPSQRREVETALLAAVTIVESRQAGKKPTAPRKAA